MVHTYNPSYEKKGGGVQDRPQQKCETLSEKYINELT
jgi:hypothetical protein